MKLMFEIIKLKNKIIYTEQLWIKLLIKFLTIFYIHTSPEKDDVWKTCPSVEKKNKFYSFLHSLIENPKHNVFWPFQEGEMF